VLNIPFPRTSLQVLFGLTWSGTLYFILHTFLHPVIIIFRYIVDTQYPIWHCIFIAYATDPCLETFLLDHCLGTLCLYCWRIYCRCCNVHSLEEDCNVLNARCDRCSLAHIYRDITVAVMKTSRIKIMWYWDVVISIICFSCSCVTCDYGGEACHGSCMHVYVCWWQNLWLVSRVSHCSSLHHRQRHREQLWVPVVTPVSIRRLEVLPLNLCLCWSAYILTHASPP